MTNRILSLLVDNDRDLHADIVCRTSLGAYEAFGALEPLIEHLMMDYDMGPGQDCGSAILGAMLEQCEAGNDYIPRVTLVTGSNHGLIEMGAILRDHGYKASPDGRHFGRPA